MIVADTEPVDRNRLAASLFAAWQHRTLITAPSDNQAFRQVDALAICDRVRALRIAAGAIPVGYKVGFTNAAVRTQFGATAPLAATVYADTLVSTRAIDAQAFLGPRIEPEVVVGVEAGGAIAWAALGFEIVQSHVADWRFGYLDAIADFGLHAALVIGDRRQISAADAERLALLQVELSCNGTVVERGAGSDVDGGACGSVTWLRDHLQRADRELLAGDLISTGSMTRVPQIAAGQRWTIAATDGALAPLSIEVR